MPNKLKESNKLFMRIITFQAQFDRYTSNYNFRFLYWFTLILVENNDDSDRILDVVKRHLL